MADSCHNMEPNDVLESFESHLFAGDVKVSVPSVQKYLFVAFDWSSTNIRLRWSSKRSTVYNALIVHDF